MSEREESIGIAGSGRVARALGRLLVDAGEPVVCVAGRNLEHAADAAAFMGPDVRAVSYQEFPEAVRKLLVAVPDRALTEVAATLAERSGARVALHTCGARGPDALAPLQARGIECGTLHPLQTISPGSSLEGIAFAVWGDPAAVEWAERIAALAHGEVLRIPPELGPLYHAGAVMASNYVMALLDAGQALLEQCGVDSATALRALGPIIRTAVENGLARGPVEALTGPIERGDVETVGAHLAALDGAPARIRRLYRAAGVQTVDISRRRGLNAECVRQMEGMLGEEARATGDEKQSPIPLRRLRIPHMLAMKRRGEKITMLTAYDATMARLLDRAGIDVLLVGDSLGTVIMGYDTTLPVTLEAVIHHSKAVSNGARRALVVADMPFLTYQVEASEAVRNAGRLLQEGGAAAVKLEGGAAVADTLRRLVSLGIPVMGHVGLTPQSVHQLGGFRAVGKTRNEADRVMEDARAVQQAGAFAVVLESVPAELAEEITRELTIPTIGIGAGPGCDGQVLVSYDAFGLFEFAPGFVKQYAKLGDEMVAAAKEYIRGRSGRAVPGATMTSELVRTVGEVRFRLGRLKSAPQEKTVALVPTMGALHAGHGALIEQARRDADTVVVSIFVNPIQFDRAEDYERYGRMLEQDMEFCGARGVDLVFAPDVSEMYPAPQKTFVEVTGVSEHLCGAFRPGHFRGVATVVMKLFSIVQPDTAYFGEKDAQQLAVIRRMVADLNLSVGIVPVATVREPDGLALSSRNQRLTPEQRRIAPSLHQALEAARHKATAGCVDAASVREAGLRRLQEGEQIRVEYFEVVDAEEMQPVERISGRVCIAAAIWLGETRLIDNVRCEVTG